MNKKFLNILIIGSLTLAFQACGDDDPVVSPSTEYSTSDYEFPSRFGDGSSVAYTGQVVRNVLIKDLKELASGNTATAAEFTDLFTNNGGNGSTAPILNPEEQTAWSDFGGNTSRLQNKIATDPLLGWNITPTAAMELWFSQVSSSTLADETRYVNADYLELNQMIGKGLLGVVAYYQGTSVYLPKMEDDYTTNGECDLNDDGSCPGYSSMEHHWDESFGYFGASRTYNTSTDDNARKSSSDIDGNGTIDYMTEYNFDWATYAAKRDIACATAGCTSDADFTGDIMGAYIEGRTLIHNEGALDDITAQRLIIQNSWEKLVAANVIHYANDVASKIESGSGILHSWAEMRAFSMALQYNSAKLISDSVLSDVITLMGVTPPAEADYTTYQTTLTGTDGVVSKLQEAYMFEDTNVNNW